MAGVSEWRTTLQTRLATIVGQRAYAYWPTQINTPAAIVRLVSGEYGADMGGGYGLTFDVLLFVGTATDFARDLAALDPYLDPDGSKSVVAALEDGQIAVTGFADVGVHEANGNPYIGVRFRVGVLA
jgi:hypothetical protein